VVRDVHPNRGAADYLGVRAGALDDPELAKPQMTIWTSSAPSWAAFKPGIHCKLTEPRALPHVLLATVVQL
jgi:hypothetical protein